MREKYFELMADRIGKWVGEDIRGSIDFKRGYCVNDFVGDYGAYKGNAYWPCEYASPNGIPQTQDQEPPVAEPRLCRTVNGAGPGRIASPDFREDSRRRFGEAF